MAPCIASCKSSAVGGMEITCPARVLGATWCVCPACPSRELEAPGVFMGITGTTPCTSFHVICTAASALPLESGMTLASPLQCNISCELSLCVGFFLDRPWDLVLDVVRLSEALLTIRMSSSVSLSLTASLAIMALPPRPPSPLEAPLSTRWLLLLCCSCDPPDELSMAQAEGGVKPVEEIPDIP